MIKVALKHWIYELCIEQIFENIKNNFVIKLNPYQFKKGEIYTYILLYGECRAIQRYNCVDCKIIDVNHKGGWFAFSCRDFNYFERNDKGKWKWKNQQHHLNVTDKFTNIIKIL